MSNTAREPWVRLSNYKADKRKLSDYSLHQLAMKREADRDASPEVAKRHGVSDASICAWRKRFGEAISDNVTSLCASTPSASRSTSARV